MASNSLPAATEQSRTRTRAEVDTAWGALASILAPVASLKLTVSLFSMSIFLVFVGTLAQVDQDMWEIINNYFHSVLVWIPLQVFLPKTLFPNYQSVPGVFPFPGGLTLGGVLFVNLLAAHSVRFKSQATSIRLGIGLLVMAQAYLVPTVRANRCSNCRYFGPKLRLPELSTSRTYCFSLVVMKGFPVWYNFIY